MLCSPYLCSATNVLSLLSSDCVSHTVTEARCHAGFSYPIILSTMGQVFSAVTALLVCRVAGFVDAAQPVSTRFYITKLLPIGGLVRSPPLPDSFYLFYDYRCATSRGMSRQVSFFGSPGPEKNTKRRV